MGQEIWAVVVDSAATICLWSVLRCQSAILGNRGGRLFRYRSDSSSSSANMVELSACLLIDRLAISDRAFWVSDISRNRASSGERHTDEEFHFFELLRLVGNEGGMDSQLIRNRCSRNAATFIELIDRHQDQPLRSEIPSICAQPLCISASWALISTMFQMKSPHRSLRIFILCHVGLSFRWR